MQYEWKNETMCLTGVKTGLCW